MYTSASCEEGDSYVYMYIYAERRGFHSTQPQRREHSLHARKPRCAEL